MGDVWSNATAERSRAFFKWRDMVAAETKQLEERNGGAATEEELKTIRKKVGKEAGCAVTFYDQYKLIRKREHPEYRNFDAQSLQNVLNKVDASYKSFIQLRVKGRSDAMPPNQKRYHRCLAYRQSGWRIEGKNLYLKHIGKFKMRLHRPIQGRIKLVSVTDVYGKWYVSFSCELDRKDIERPKKTGRQASVALIFEFEGGIFLRSSAGEVVSHPEFYWQRLAGLRRLSRALSRKQKGSRNWLKARRALVKYQETTARKRDYFLWALARFYAAGYLKVEIPKWPLKEMIQYAATSSAARTLCDGAYGKFVAMLRHKCSEYETELLERKEEKWQERIRQLNEVARAEAIKPLLRKTRKMLGRQCLEALPSLQEGFERAATLQICSGQ